MQTITARFFNLITVLELVALLFSLFTLSSKNEKGLRTYIPILSLIFFAKIFGFVIHKNYPVQNIAIHYTIEIFFTIGIVSIIIGFWHSQKFKIYLKSMLTLYVITSIGNAFFYQSPNSFSTNALIFSVLVIFSGIFLAIIEIGILPYRISLMREPLFWICCSMIFYYLPTAVMTASYDYFCLNYNSALENGQADLLSQKILNVLHYGLLP